jgi:MFS family permease
MPSSGFMGLNRNLWKLAAVMGVVQFSVSLWKWEFSIFLRTMVDPWQMGLIFSFGTLASLVAAFVSGTVADLIGRKRSMAFGLIPVAVGLMAMSYLSFWPFIILQFGLVWYGLSTIRVISQAMPADEIAKDEGRNPARRFMMVLMPLWFVDGLGPLIGASLLSSGFTSSDLHRFAAVGAIVAFFVVLLAVEESLDADTMEKARAGAIISFRQLGGDFWKLAVGMVGFSFFFTSAISYLGNLSVEEWGVSTVTYGYTWSAFSFTSFVLIYAVSGLADRNLKAALLLSMVGNGLVYIAFGLGSGASGLYLLNILWAVPFIVWLGTEKSLITANVPEEAKGRALGTYQFLMSSIAMVSALFGALLWEVTNSLRTVWIIAGGGMLCTVLLLIPILRSIETRNHQD